MWVDRSAPDVITYRGRKKECVRTPVIRSVRTPIRYHNYVSLSTSNRLEKTEMTGELLVSAYPTDRAEHSDSYRCIVPGIY